MRYKKPYVTQETSAEYLLNKINMYPMLIPHYNAFSLLYYHLALTTYYLLITFNQYSLCHT